MTSISSDETLRIFVYDYLKKNAYNDTAEIFLKEAHVTKLPAAAWDRYPRGFLHDYWTTFYYTRQRQMAASSTQVPAWSFTPLILGERYATQLIGDFQCINTLLACAFSSDGQILACGGFDRKVVLCYMDTCDCITLEGHTDNITDVRFKPGSTIFATSSADRTVKLWDAAQRGILLSSLEHHNGWLKSLDFHPTKEILASSNSFDIMELWNVGNVHRCIRMNKLMAGGRQVRFQPRIGRFLAIAAGKVINILDIETWTSQISLQGHVTEVLSICWDITGQMIASVSEDSARVWSVSVSRQCLYSLSSNGRRYQSIVYHPRYHDALLIGGAQGIQLWVPDSGSIVTVPASNGPITGLTTSTQNQFIASASTMMSCDSLVQIWK